MFCILYSLIGIKPLLCFNLTVFFIFFFIFYSRAYKDKLISVGSRRAIPTLTYESHEDTSTKSGSVSKSLYTLRDDFR